MRRQTARHFSNGVRAFARLEIMPFYRRKSERTELRHMLQVVAFNRLIIRHPVEASELKIGAVKTFHTITSTKLACCDQHKTIFRFWYGSCQYEICKKMF